MNGIKPATIVAADKTVELPTAWFPASNFRVLDSMKEPKPHFI